MTRAAALAHVRDSLRGQEITSELNGRPVPSFAVVSREALATLVDGDWIVRPLSVVEAERSRAEMAAGSALQPADSQQPPDSGPVVIRCAECGGELELFEVAWIAKTRGSKFEQLCQECCRLKLGLR